jgi:hypothetical protein
MNPYARLRTLMLLATGLGIPSWSAAVIFGSMNYEA